MHAHKARHVVNDMEEMSMSNNGFNFRFAMLWKPRKSGNTRECLQGSHITLIVTKNTLMTT